jgi:hypothetical protein
MYKKISPDQKEGGFGVAPTARDRLKQVLNEGLRIQTLRTVLLIQAIATRAGINPNRPPMFEPADPVRTVDTQPASRGDDLTKGGAITAMIDRLETIDRLEIAGDIHRRRDTQDRRQILLHITPGEPLRRLMAHFEAVSEAITALTADYTDDQLQLITEFITHTNDVIRH